MPKPINKIRVAIIFGGRSAEHEVSIVSARSVFMALDRTKYEPLLIGITHQGRWITGSSAELLMGTKLPDKLSSVLVPDPNARRLVPVERSNRSMPTPAIDVIFPLLHGPYGEDGTVQGLFDLTGIPYVGSGVLGSALGMDKVIQKELFARAGLPIVKYVYFTRAEWTTNSRVLVRHIISSLGWPVFVKPANMGSSVGITKADNKIELVRAIAEAFKYDNKIIVEVSVERARELECGVLGNDNPNASEVGEVMPSNEFYDYNAKYVDGQSRLLIPAPIRPKLRRTIRRLAVSAFRTINASGLARVDFLFGRGRLYLNEINTMPGFTAISMYPKLFEASGVKYRTLVERLINLAIERSRSRQSLRVQYHPRKAWYRSK